MARPESIGRFVGIVGGSSLPPVSASIMAWYTSSNGALDSGDARADNYEAVKTWLDSKGFGTLYPLSQSTGALRPKYRSFGRRGVYTDANSVYLNQPDISIDQRSFSFFALIDQADQFVNSGGYTKVLFEIVGVGSLRLVEASQGVGVIKWVDGGGTDTSTLTVPAGLSLVGVTLSASAVTVWVNDTSQAFTALSAGTATGFNLFNTAADAGVWTGGCQEAILYNVALSAGQKAQLDTYAQSRGAYYVSNTTAIMASHGDSISTWQSAEDLLGFAGQASRGTVPLYILGLGGITFANLANLYAFTDAIYDINKRCVLWVNCGHNDIAAGVAAATVTASRRAYIDRQRDKGWLILENNVAPSSGITAGEETVRTTFNTDMGTDSTRRYANAVATVPAELSDHTNLTYFNADGIHWTHAGHAAMLGQGQASLTTLLETPLDADLLQAEYNFDGDVVDDSSYTRDLEAVNTPTYASGVGGHQCLVTASSGNRHARYTRSVNVFPWLPFSIMFWIKTTATPTKAIVTNFSSGAGKGWQVYIDTGGVLGGFYIPDLGGGHYAGGIAGTTPINDGIWHACAYTVNATNSKIYVSPDENAANLALENTGSWTGTPQAIAGNDTRVYVGSGDGSASFDLSIQALRIWAEVRTLAELQAMLPYEPI